MGGSPTLRALGLFALLASAASGCEAPESEAGALLLATLDTHHFCDMDSLMDVQLRAYWQACPQAQRECEPPPSPALEGDRYSCPATDATHQLGVWLTHPGRYRIEAVGGLAAGDDVVECFRDPTRGDTQIELPESRLVGQAPVVLDEHGACPP